MESFICSIFYQLKTSEIKKFFFQINFIKAVYNCKIYHFLIPLDNNQFYFYGVDIITHTF